MTNLCDLGDRLMMVGRMETETGMASPPRQGFFSLAWLTTINT